MRIILIPTVPPAKAISEGKHFEKLLTFRGGASAGGGRRRGRRPLGIAPTTESDLRGELRPLISLSTSHFACSLGKILPDWVMLRPRV